MKKIISILLAVMLVVSVAAVTVHAEYAPEDSYTVAKDTPTCEEAIEACGGGDTQTVYFQLPAEDPDHPERSWTNHFNSTDLGLDYCQVCVYWYGKGVGVKWPSGAEQKWVGYKATLIDAENRIYRATVPNDGGSAVIIWNNGVNGGMDEKAEIFNYARQLMDMNIEGLDEDEADSLPEGTPDPDSCDGCITIIDYSVKVTNSLTGFDSFGGNWYIYYDKGCYGMHTIEEGNDQQRIAECINPEHHHLVPGDVNNDKYVDVNDATSIQRYLADLEEFDDDQKDAADIDGDKFISVMDATRIQRYLAGKCDLFTK